MNRLWLITGVSRGLGRALAERALEAGESVIGTSRSGKEVDGLRSDRMRMVRLSLDDPEVAEREIRSVLSASPEVDVLVNNAGHGFIGAVEETSMAEALAVLNANFLGAMAVIRAVLPGMRVARKGHVINISSISGIAPYGGSALYAASKSALGGFSVALAQEVEPFGIKVTVVSPGAFRTDFASSRSLKASTVSISGYERLVESRKATFREATGNEQGDPDRAAEIILGLSLDPEPPLDLVLGPDAVARARENLVRFEADLDRAEHLSAGTSFRSG